MVIKPGSRTLVAHRFGTGFSVGWGRGTSAAAVSSVDRSHLWRARRHCFSTPAAGPR